MSYSNSDNPDYNTNGFFNNQYMGPAAPSSGGGGWFSSLFGGGGGNRTDSQFAIPGMGGASGSNAATGLGMNLGTAQLGIGGLGALAGLWNGMQARELASKQFDFTKRTTETNLANQLQTYNTALADRARSRGVVEGQSQAQVDDYLARNRLTSR